MDKFSTSVTIDAAPAQVWAALTVPDLMVKWMGEPEINIEIQTNWEVNSPIYIRGFHHVKFEDKGIVLHYDQLNKLIYNHLSSVSRLPDTIENYSILEFILTAHQNQTLLTLHIENFPTATIRKHLEFYWRSTIYKIKKQIEN